MMQNSATRLENSSIEIADVSFSDVSKQSRLFLDYQQNSGTIDAYYPEKHTPLKEFAEKVLANYKIDRNKLCDILLKTNKDFGGNIKTFLNIELLRQSNCVAVVTGQQAGIFSGAVYTIYKALSAIKLSKELRDQNIKAVPVFWIAEEDHDFDEIKKSFAIGKEGRLCEFENTPQNYTEDLPVGLIKLDESIDTTIEELFGQLELSEFTKEIKQIVSAAYKKGETFSTAFAKFLTTLFKDHGLIMLSPLNPEIKVLSAPIFTEAIRKTNEIVEKLLNKGKKLERDNYHAQVLVEENSFPFFYHNENGERLALRRDFEKEKIVAKNSNKEFDETDIIEIAGNEPQKLSPNALLRPVVQDYLLPTITYFGGGAEISYFAQNAAIYETLDRPITPIRHRSSFSIITGKNRRTLTTYNLDFTDIFRGEDEILSDIVEKFLANDVAKVFNEVEENINKQLNNLDQSLKHVEITLAANLENRRKKINWHISTLRKKYHQAEIIKDKVLQRRIETLFTFLLPHDVLQERTLNVITFLNLYGTNFINWLYDAVDNDEKGHQILFL